MLKFVNGSAYLANLVFFFLSQRRKERKRGFKDTSRYVGYVETSLRLCELCERFFCRFMKVLYLCVQFINL